MLASVFAFFTDRNSKEVQGSDGGETMEATGGQSDQKVTAGLGMSNLQLSMQLQADVFYHYSSKEGSKSTLNKSELKELLNGELKDLINCDRNPEALEEMMAELDASREGEITFMDFAYYIAMLTVSLHMVPGDPDRCSMQQQQQQQQQQQRR
ncbi:protein S100-A1 [Brachionichthys hirsutus]|uniref:protein S100-A1 n=1 Tax=Brachionichthys hirsutus TaxID=412623 RepID=UPI0036050DBD